MEPIDIAPADLETVRRILRERAPGLEARAFGSRVAWTARETSDLDLALMTDEPLDAMRMAVMKAAFTDSDLPFRVDIVDWASASKRFREIVERNHIVLADADRADGEGRWRNLTLGDCVKINNSVYSPKEKWPFINYLDTGSITDNHISSIQHLIPGKDKIPTRARRKACSGDMVYSTVRPNHRHYGLLKSIPRNFLVSTGFSVLRGISGVASTDFIYYFLTQDRIVEHLQAIAEHNTSAYPALRPEDLERLAIDLPPLPEQRAIAAILRALDDKIALNRRMNETLEAMARAVFEDWFVHFGPIRAKLEGRKPYLASEIWSLFPDSLEKIESHYAPRGWKITKISGLMEINPRRTLKKGRVAPYLDMASMPVKVHAPAYIPSRPVGSGMRFINGDTLVARMTVCLENGKTAYVDFLPDGDVGWGSTEYIVLRPMPPLPNEFAYCLARNANFREFAIRSATGTTRQRVPAAALSQFQIAAPPAPVAEAFGNFVRPIFAQASAFARESRTLAGARDSLLPCMMSGDIKPYDVGEAGV